MFILKKIGCRLFQLSFRSLLPILPYREPKIVPSCRELGQVCKAEGADAVLIVTDAGIIKNGLVVPLEAVLKENGVSYTIYDKTQPNPTVANVEAAVALYRENGCKALIAIGGGSAMDCAKAVGARIAYPKRQVGQMGGILRVLRKIPTLIAIPTTAGTGSETTLAAVITDERASHKYALMSFPLIPNYAVLDPELTYTLPPQLTATTGMDALTHAVEAYIGRSTSRQTRALALSATKLIFANIQSAYLDGSNRVARENMLHAAYQAGVAFSKSYVGYIHAVAHSLGGRYGTPHGLANAVVMPYVLESYGKCAYRKLHRLAVAAGVSAATDSDQAGAEKFIQAIRDLNRTMNIPAGLSGIQADDIPLLAKHAEKEANPLYPVPKLMTAKELESIYQKIANLVD